MKMSSIRFDSARLEGGEWVAAIPGLDGLRLKVRGQGNLDDRRVQARQLDALGPEDRDEAGHLSPEAIDRLTGERLLDTVLLDWEGVEAEDATPETPKAEPYGRDLARPYLTHPDYRVFQNGVARAAAQVAQRAATRREADAKH
jgi:hypothetical protein